MASELDVPNLPFKKPKSLSDLERLSSAQREAMDFEEQKERIQFIADSLAKAYAKNKNGDFEGCVLVITSALSETGGSIDGEMGANMVGLSHQAAETACRLVYPEPI